MDPTYYGLSSPTNYHAPRKGLNLKLVIFALLGMIALAVSWWLISSSSGSGNLPQQLLYRLSSVQKLLDDGQKSLHNDELKKITAETSIILLGHSAVLKKSYPLPSKPDKKSQAMINSESVTDILKQFSDAKLNGTYEITYKRVLLQKLNETHALVSEIEQKTKSSSALSEITALKQHISKFYEQLNAIQV